MSVRFLINPTAGRGRARRAIGIIRSKARGAEVVETRDRAHLEAESRRAVEEGVERLVIAGGDGSMHQAIQALAGSECALAVLPLGSGNDLAAVLGMPKKPGPAAEVALTAPVTEMDLGRIAGHYFALYCGVGLDGAISKIYDEEIRWPRGTAGYIRAALRAMMRFEPSTVTLESEHGRSRRAMTLVLVANGYRAGGGMKVAPMAQIDDGKFELVQLDAVPRRAILGLLGKVFRGAHLGHPAVHHSTVTELSIASEPGIWAYGDGERLVELGAEPVEVEMHPRVLRVVSALAQPGRT